MKSNDTLRFCEQLDTLLLIEKGMIPHRGEDSFCCVSRGASALVSVFDGCGGLGARTYPGFREHTGAYMASRLISGAVHSWYCDTFDTRWKSTEQMLASLNRYFAQAYGVGTGYTQSNLRIRGSMVRDFPTTAAIAIAQQQGDAILLHVIWAGDSRVYLMDSQGLAQLTRDDADSEDAFSNLSDDGALTNVISSDGNYELHYKCITLREPTIVFAATDGCFGYLPTPMEFEYALLAALVGSGNTEEFRTRLAASFQETTGDDFALGLMSFGFGTFEKLRSSFESRLHYLEENYVFPLQSDRNIGFARQLWEVYRCSYERCL